MGNPTVHISQLQNIQWLDGSNCNFALTETNHIWRIRISAFTPQIHEFWNLLNAEEQERANRYYHEKDKERFIVSRACLRILLGRYLNLDVSAITFQIGENKKPNIKGSTHLHYNVSHSGDYVLIAVSPSPVGVDVELPDAKIDPDEIMQVSYSKPEIDHVHQSANRLQAFYTLWTRKEALLKATAKGIDNTLKFIPCIDGFHTTLYNTIGSKNNFIVNSFKVDDEHLGSVASAYPATTFWDIN